MGAHGWASPTSIVVERSNGIHVPTSRRSRRARRLTTTCQRTGASASTTRPCGSRRRHSRSARVGDQAGDRTWTSSRSCANARQLWKEDERVTAARVVAAGTLLDPSALTIGLLALHRSAGRKLIFHNPSAGAASLDRGAPARAVPRLRRQGHPAGKHNIQKVYHRCSRAASPTTISTWPISSARECDVWLNNPREAARSVRHARLKLDQRRAAPEHRRRLVGGRLHRREGGSRAAARAMREAVDAADAESLHQLRTGNRADLRRIATRKASQRAVVRHRSAGHPVGHRDLRRGAWSRSTRTSVTPAIGRRRVVSQP